MWEKTHTHTHVLVYVCIKFSTRARIQYTTFIRLLTVKYAWETDCIDVFVRFSCIDVVNRVCFPQKLPQLSHFLINPNVGLPLFFFIQNTIIQYFFFFLILRCFRRPLHSYLMFHTSGICCFFYVIFSSHHNLSIVILCSFSERRLNTTS